MKPTPSDWPRIAAALFYRDPRQAIDWLCRAFGFSVRMVVDGPDGRVEHSELEYGEGLIMVAGAGPAYAGKGEAWRAPLASPGMVGGRITQNLFLYVDDVEAHCARAREHGARICSEPQTSDYGADYWVDRGYAAFDPEGHLWWFAQRLSTRGVPHG